MINKSIGLVLSPGSCVSARLIEGLSEWSNVSLRPVDRPNPDCVDGLIIVTGEPYAALKALRASRVPVLVVTEAATQPPDRESIHFADLEAVDHSLRGLSVPEPEGVRPTDPPNLAGGVVLANKGDRPAWMGWRGDDTELTLSLCGVPEIPPNGYLHEHFGTRRFLSLLPWLDFVRRVRGSDGWDAPTPQACIVFDDPSLYRPRYGFVDFEALARHASAHHHHVAIATVPIDLAKASHRTAAIFREHRASLSLLVHGNDHLSWEMARPWTSHGRLQMASQSIRRAHSFELKHGIPIRKVMEAPHAVFAPEMFSVLLSVGFEGVLVTPELIQFPPQSHPWSPAFALAADETFDGLPWVNRIRWRKGWRTDVLLSSFLRQPLVVVGHHPDVADGLEELGDIAKTINRQGNVRWSPVDELIRRRACQRRAGDTLIVKTHAYHATISVSPDVRSLVVEVPRRPGTSIGSMTLSQGGAVIADLSTADSVVGPIPIHQPGEVSMVRTVPNAVNPSLVPQPPTRVWPILRKVIVEIRDRSGPLRAARRVLPKLPKPASETTAPRWSPS